MKTGIQTSVIYPFATAVCVVLLASCESIRERHIYERTDPNRTSIDQTRDAFDTLGRKWGEAETPKPVAAGQPAVPQSTAPANYLVNLTKTAPRVVGMGEPFNYDLTVTAQTDVADVTVIDMMPQGLSYISSEPEAARDGNKLIWKFDGLNRGESRTIRVTVKGESAGELVNCATVSATPRVCFTTVVGKAQLALKKTGPETAELGSDVTYNIVVQNTGNSVAKDVVVTDSVPDGLSSATGQKELKSEVGNLAPGESKSIPVVLHADKSGRYLNKALATASNAEKVEGEAPTTIVHGAVKITKSTQDKNLFINRTATYNIEVSNPGDTELTGVVVTDTADSRTVIATAEGATVTGNTAKWNLGTLAAGEKKNLTVKIVSKVPGQFTDTAMVTTDQGLHDSANDLSEWRGVTGVLVEAVDDPDPIQVGEVSTYTIKVTNQGSTVDIRDLNIVVTVPPELEVVPGSISEGGTLRGSTITWPTVPTVAPKAVVTHTYTAKGVKAGDARTKVAVTTSSRQDPIEKFESTTVY
jgi:uncharacterized repeat protein (TIGR01451 family)